MEELYWNDKLAVAASYTKFRNDRSLFTSYYCFDRFNSFYGYSLKFLMRKNMDLINALNRFIEQAIESGLINKWLKGNQFEPFNEKPPEFQYIEADISNYVIVILMCSCILLFASLILYIEKFVDKKVRANNSARFWRYIEMGIDADRHFLLNDLMP